MHSPPPHKRLGARLDWQSSNLRIVEPHPLQDTPVDNGSSMLSHMFKEKAPKLHTDPDWTGWRWIAGYACVCVRVCVCVCVYVCTWGVCVCCVDGKKIESGWKWLHLPWQASSTLIAVRMSEPRHCILL